jgi:hypothetical protein
MQNDEIWKSKIANMKHCVHVWISRNLTCTGKTLIVKNLLISSCGYEIEMRGIPEIYVKKYQLWYGDLSGEGALTK